MPSEIKLINHIPILNQALQDAIEEGLEKFGQVAEVKMTQRIDSYIPPPLSEATIKRKESSQPLVDTGELYGQITHEVAGDGKSVKIGVIGSRATIAAIHEFGAPAANIPERSFIRAIMDNQNDRTEMNEQVIIILRKAIKESTIK